MCSSHDLGSNSCEQVGCLVLCQFTKITIGGKLCKNMHIFKRNMLKLAKVIEQKKDDVLESESGVQENLISKIYQLLPDRRGGRPESSLSLRSHGGGTPPPLLAPGRVTSLRRTRGE